MGNYAPNQNNQSAPKLPVADHIPVVDNKPKMISYDANKKYIKHSDLQKAFKSSSKNGFLDLNQFNQAIVYLFKFDIPQLSFTYLSENLFQLIDKVIIT
jgi:hypothetical protein